MKKIVYALALLSGVFMGTNNAAQKEIEIKFTLADDKVVELRQWLTKNATYVGQQNQKEQYLNNPKETNVFKSPHGFMDMLKVLRVRCTDQGDWVCCKNSKVDPITGKALYKYEAETKVDDGKVMIEILESYGFTDKIFVNKKRDIYVSGDFEIVIDEVEKLGTFIEVELKRECNDPHEGLTAIKAFLKSIGIDSYNQFHRSYIHMFLNPGYNFSETVVLK